MAINKNAYIRYMVIDECLTTWEDRKRTSENIRRKCAYEVQLKDDSGYSAKDEIISERLFQLDLKNIELIWGEKAKIVRQRLKFGENKRKYFYSYKDSSFSIMTAPLSNEQKECLTDLVQTFSLFSGLPHMEWMKTAESNLKLTLNNDSSQPIISFEENFNDIVNVLLPHLAVYIKKHQVIDIISNSPRFGRREYKVSPLYLKQYNKRWYLYGFCHFVDDYKLYTFPVDEIEGPTIKEDQHTSFHNEEIDWNEYFSQAIGATVIKENKVEKISLRITDAMVCFLLSNNPVHQSQTIEFCNEERSEMILTIEVRKNWELMNFLRRYAGCIEILEPLSLKEEYIELLRKGIKLNEN